MEERDPFGTHRYVNYDDYGYDNQNWGGYQSREYSDPWEQQEYNGYQDWGNFYQENQYQQEWESDYPSSPPQPVYEEKDQGSTESLEDFIKAQIARQEEIANELRKMNEQFERDRRDHEAGLQNVKRELDWVENRYESWAPNQLSYETQQDPTSQYNHYQKDQDYDQSLEYYLPPVTNKKVNEIKTGSDFEYVGMSNEWVVDEEEDEYWEVEEEEKISVESNEGMDVDEPVQVEIVPIELEIDPEQVEIVQIEVEKIFEEVECVDNAQMETLPNPLSDEIFEEKAIEEFSELDFELLELLGEESGTSIEGIDMDYEDITLEEIEEMFALSTDPPSTQIEKPNRGTKRSEPEPEFEEHYNSVCSFPLFPSLSCLETSVVLQVKEEEFAGSWDDYVDPFERRNGHFAEKVLNDESYGYSNRHKNDTISRETREWHDAWVKNRVSVNVSNKEVLLGDHG